MFLLKYQEMKISKNHVTQSLLFSETFSRNLPSTRTLRPHVINVTLRVCQHKRTVI